MTAAPRVVSLVPSVTETLLAWGVTPIAVTRFCEHPELPAVGGTKNPDVTEITRLAPDLVVMNDEENRKEDADAIETAGLQIVVLTVESLADVEPALGKLADALELTRPAFTLPEEEKQRRRRAFVPIWRRPWMTFNARTYGSSLLAHIGVDNVFADSDDRYPTVSLDDAAARQPGVVLAPSEPYVFTDKHVPELSAVAPVELVDGQDLFWWGARTPAAIERLRARLARIAP
ncbi:MAG: ABC transporter substrate-binding protein [Actinobacteria bacterium]|nr:ABC transporter substrate-binding protein [Actinomycetota bacterium]